MSYLKKTPVDIQQESLKQIVSTLSKEDQEKVEAYTDRFVRMVNKGGLPVKIALTIVGVEMSREPLEVDK